MYWLVCEDTIDIYDSLEKVYEAAYNYEMYCQPYKIYKLEEV